MASSSSKTSHLALHFLETRDPSHPTTSSPSLLSQIQHRLQLVSSWSIAPSSRILEIGCGQGDTTIALADAVGEGGWVDAVDPGSPDYGSPFTLSQAQAHISSTELGPRIQFHNLNPTEYITHNTGPPYDYIILSHSIFYFSSPRILPELITSLATLPGKPKLCIAEWSLRANGPATYPHVLTSLLFSLLESKRVSESKGNIRTVLSPSQITHVVCSTSEFTVAKEEFEETGPGMQDAFWEVGDVLRRIEGGRLFDGTVESSEAEKTVVGAMGDAVVSAVDALEDGVKGVRCMDVWTAVFERV